VRSAATIGFPSFSGALLLAFGEAHEMTKARNKMYFI